MHRRRDSPEDLAVRQRFAERLDRFAVVHHVQMSVRFMQIFVLELRRRRQQYVRVIRGIGLEVLEDHREKIFAPQSAQHGLAIGSDRGRIRVVDDHRFDRRIVRLRQRFAEADHVDRAGAPGDVAALAAREVNAERSGGRQLTSTAGIVPGACDGR